MVVCHHRHSDININFNNLLDSHGTTACDFEILILIVMSGIIRTFLYITGINRFFSKPLFFRFFIKKFIYFLQRSFLYIKKPY